MKLKKTTNEGVNLTQAKRSIYIWVPVDVSGYVIFPSKIKWDLSNGPLQEVTRAIRYSGFFVVRSVGPVGDFLDI